jgi:hypothetical protein
VKRNSLIIDAEEKKRFHVAARFNHNQLARGLRTITESNRVRLRR